MTIRNYLGNSVVGLLCILVITFSAHAEGSRSNYINQNYQVESAPSGGAMVIDALFARPLGLVATVVGTAVYTVSLPFSLTGGNEHEARENLVYAPADFTFDRPLGKF
jgi:hypothetical protein